MGDFESEFHSKKFHENCTTGHGRVFASAKGKQKKSSFDSYSVRKSAIDHIPYHLSALSRARFLATHFLEIAIQCYMEHN